MKIFILSIYGSSKEIDPATDLIILNILPEHVQISVLIIA